MNERIKQFKKQFTPNERMNKQQIIDEAIFYSSHIDFTDDKNLSEKGRLRVKEWAKQDFISGANYVLRQSKPIGT